MNKHNKWFCQSSYQKEILDTFTAVYIVLKKIKAFLKKTLSIDLYYYKELEIIFANIRV
jgi:hypothetical protein